MIDLDRKYVFACKHMRTLEQIIAVQRNFFLKNSALFEHL